MEADNSQVQIRALRERLAKLSAASLHISESLKVDTVLREVVESIRVLTRAGSSSIVTMDEVGELEDFVSSGLSPEEHQQCVDLPRGLDLWVYLRQIPKPLRLMDLAAHLTPLGFPDYRTLARSFISVPIRHRGVQVGNFYLADKEAGQAFTDEDEEVLTLFASQVGAAIANARMYRDSQLARANLEALIDTSPVGVVVLDAESGHVVSVNREARHIVRELCLPGQPAEELLEVLRVRRADGREIELEKASLSKMLRAAISVRAEEIILEGQNGQKVTTLVNATPLISGQGAVESVVVTLQDMAPLEELERMRAEWLGMVSHELRAPLSSIKGCSATVLGTSTVLDPAEMMQFFRIIDAQADHMRMLIGDLLDASRIETGTLSVAPEPARLAVIVDQARSMFLSAGGRHTIHIDLPPDLPWVLADQPRIVQVVGNLLSNAARHSPESSPICVAAVQDGVHMAISVTDDGRGIPAERLSYLFRKFARSGREDQGRGIGVGLGLAICKGLVEAHGGRIWAESAGPGLGTRFSFTIPTAETAAEENGTTSTPRTVGRLQQSKPHVLVVDDDPHTLAHVRGILEKAGFRAIVTGDPSEVPALITSHQPDLVLLDLLLPGTDGIELMESVPALADRPVIFLSGYGRDETIARALNIGAVDYIVKPFSPTELVARIRAALRKLDKQPAPFQAGELAIDYKERRVTLAGRSIKLTATEYNLLRILSANAGRVLTHDYLLRRVWRSYPHGSHSLVRAFVKKLRRKLGDNAGSPTYIFTEPRVGYRMVKSDDR